MLPLVLSIVALILSILAFVGAAVAAVFVIGWKNSTHRILQVPSNPAIDPLGEESAQRTATPPPVTYEYDLPPHLTEPESIKEYLRNRHEIPDEELYEPNFGDETL